MKMKFATKIPSNQIILINLSVWRNWGLQSMKYCPTVLCMMHGRTEVCVIRNCNWKNHFYFALRKKKTKHNWISGKRKHSRPHKMKYSRLYKLITIGTSAFCLKLALSRKVASVAASEDKELPLLVFHSSQASSSNSIVNFQPLAIFQFKSACPKLYLPLNHSVVCKYERKHTDNSFWSVARASFQAGLPRAKSLFRLGCNQNIACSTAITWLK